MYHIPTSWYSREFPQSPGLCLLLGCTLQACKPCAGPALRPRKTLQSLTGMSVVNGWESLPVLKQGPGMTVWKLGRTWQPAFLPARDGYQRRQWQPTPVLLPGKSHGWRSLVGCSPWGHEESDMTERLHFHFSLSCIGGGNGNPLQCSCLENSRDGGAWWAANYGVAQSRT